MIQRYIYSAVFNGLGSFRDDPDLFTQLFTTCYGLDPSETAQIVTYFSKHAVNLYQGYPPEQAVFPLVTIILAGEEQSDLILNRQAGAITDPSDPNYQKTLHSAIWNHTYQLLCYAENPDICQYLYEMVKSAIVGSYDYLRQNDVDNVTLSGMDLSPDMIRLPEHLFARVMQVQCRHELLQAETTPANTAFKVGNIYAPAASDKDNGGVIAGVSVQAAPVSD